mmetsp:Transcript_19362/g.17168  ORF Transcript_19362/g.17168 Transcript_19362/m.17168 type:complete len:81 (-) Transcript_19362:133-375(-)
MKNWKRIYKEKDNPVSPTCVVCLEDFELGEDIIELRCNSKLNGHIFHPNCINSWSKNEKTCPVCRKDFIDDNRNREIRSV